MSGCAKMENQRLLPLGRSLAFRVFDIVVFGRRRLMALLAAESVIFCHKMTLSMPFGRYCLNSLRNCTISEDSCSLDEIRILLTCRGIVTVKFDTCTW